MPILNPIRFDGTLSIRDHAVPIAFRAGMDDDGGLTLALDPIQPARAGTPFHVEGEPLQAQAACSLDGRSDDGWRFASDTLYVTSWRRPPNDRVEIEADCSIASFSRDVPTDHQDLRAWYFRKLGTIRGIERQTRLGRLVFTGYTQRPMQVPAAVIAIHAGAQERAGWWEESERFLIHLARVLSFASDVYALPVYEQSVRHGVMTLRVIRRGPAPSPYMPPFDALFMDQIFACAVRIFDERPGVIEQLEPAIRWMTAGVAYQESRLLNAMSALESILARSDLPDRFMDQSAFTELKRRVRRFLRAEHAPSRMGGKVDELNRRSFRDKIADLIASRGIIVADLPSDWLPSLIEARNVLVHTGVAPDLAAPDGRLLDHIIWAREIVTRIILDAIGFSGQYQSWLHRSAYLSFPGCRPMSEVAAGLSINSVRIDRRTRR
ncbi:hypothetical protein QE385_003943 [Sphingomonas sp. SORGH_AS 950]|uniref:HEPN domain-containing protein n=1 Tax=Sphingomonas sp. SORGH_AS_0950 TaxID=3041792 RepID=UPI002784AA77|nr:HEPN domain-containing protein [Sphingomonas sp. SORGH_AS_0950]MDQ1159546.1 hypothetical protein [Sphingomonas sp. SORGH_AS_0950]